MATKSAMKRLRQSEKRRMRNKAVKSEIKTTKKKMLAAAGSKNKELAGETLKKVASLYDKAVKKGIIKPNTASRNKSRLATKVNGIK